MKTVLVPTFDEFNKYAFIKNVKVKIKNNPDSKDYKKITKLLPGLCMGAVGPNSLSDLMKNGQKSIRDFYDARQNTRMLKGYFVMVS